MKQTQGYYGPGPAGKELEVRLHQQAALTELGQYALSGAQMQDFLDHAMQMVAQTLGLELSHLLELQPNGDKLLLRAGQGWLPGLVGHALFSAAPDTLAGYALQSKEPVRIEDLHQEMRFQTPSLMQDHGVMSGLNLALRVQDQTYGLIGAHTAQQRRFRDHDVNFLQSVANIVAMVIERSRNESMIRELSTPVLQIFPGVLLVPVIGKYDKVRARQAEDTLLQAIYRQRARTVVIDLTAAYFEAEASDRLTATVKAAKLQGACVLISGFSGLSRDGAPGISNLFEDITMVVDLESGIQRALQLSQALTA